MNDVIDRIKAAAAAHADAYVTVPAADLAALCAVPAVAATELGRVLAGCADRATRAKGDRPQVVDVHRTFHLDKLLALVPA